MRATGGKGIRCDTGTADGPVGLAVFWQHGTPSLDWFAGMTRSTAAEYRAAATGRAALETYLASAGSTLRY